MALEITCQQCNFTGRVSEQKLGKTVRCPKCSNAIVVGADKQEPVFDAVEVVEDEPPAVSRKTRSRNDDEGGTYGLSDEQPTRRPRPSVIPRSPIRERPASRPLLPSGTGSDDGGGGGEFNGIIGFVLLFGVGNAILYYFTGIVIIPIRR